MNTKVEVTFNSDITRATCKFLQFQWQIDNAYNVMHYCSISYEPLNDNDYNRQQMIFGTSLNNTVDLNFPNGSLVPGRYYRFTVNASDNFSTTLIRGRFNKEESKLIIE